MFGVSLPVRLFCSFFAKNSGNCFNILIISWMGTRVHGSTSDEPWATFLTWTMRSRREFCAILANFCLNLVTMATPFAPLKFQVAYLNSPTPKTLLFVWKVLVFFCAELLSVQFLLTFAQIWLPWQLSWLPWKFRWHIWNRWPQKPCHTRQKCVDILYTNEVMVIWMFCVFFPLRV